MGSDTPDQMEEGIRTAQVAFKEWAVVLHALLSGEQTLLLRKGGIHETQGEFTVAHRVFFLYPTYTHQQISRVHPRAARWFESIERERPAEGWFRIEGWAEVRETCYLTDPDRVAALGSSHVWTIPTVLERFHDGVPGIHLMLVRVYRMEPQLMPMRPQYGGCRSWVTLEHPPALDFRRPVLGETDFKEKSEEIQRWLKG